MIPSLIVLGLVLLAAALGFRLQARATRGPDRGHTLVRALHPTAQRVGPNTLAFTAEGRQVTVHIHEDALSLTTQLPEVPLPWRKSARALGDGVTLALLATSGLTAGDASLTLRLAIGRLNVRGLRAGLRELVRIAARLEALDLPAALARHLLDHAPAEARLSLFQRLVADYPHAPATRQCAQSYAADQQQPELRAAATSWLADHPTTAGPQIG